MLENMTIDSLGAKASMGAGLRVGAMIGLFLVGTFLTAQTVIGPGMLHKGPFQDPIMDGIMQRILHHMDAFHADSSMFWIGKGLTHINDREAIEEEYYLLTYRAEVLYYEGLFTEAMEDLDRAMPLALMMNDSVLVSNVHNLRGLLHENIQASDKAVPYMRLALQWYPRRKPEVRYPISELFHINGNLGSYLLQIGELDSAALHLHRSLQQALEAQAPRATAVAWCSLGKLALKQQRPDSAVSYYQRAIDWADAHVERDVQLDAYAGLATAHLAQGRPRATREVLARGLRHEATYPEKIGLVTLRNFARDRSVILKAIGAVGEALQAIDEWHGMDSTITARNGQAAMRLQAELLRTDANLAMERVERLRYADALERVRFQRQVVLVSSVVAILILLGLYMIYRIRQRGLQQLAELDLLRLQQEATITELRIRDQVSQDMHDDLGVGLSALKLRTEMVARVEPDAQKQVLFNDLSRQAGELIGSMRQIIWAMNRDQGSLEDLAAYASSYARTYLAEHGLQADVNSEGPWPDLQLTPEQRRNLFLVLKEALHNIVKHARASRVHVQLSWDGQLHLNVSDDGIGLKGQPNGSQGNGLRNIHHRIGSMGGSCQLTSDSGTALLCTVPLGQP